jgi:hypothetical protein
VCRVIIFAVIFSRLNSAEAVYCAQVPECLRIVPAGVNVLYALIPISAGIGHLATVLCRLSCLAAMLGVFTRASAWTAVITATYCLALPYCFGKVCHSNHFLISFAALLASSNCADVLSLDAVKQARKLARQNAGVRPQPSIQYALPLRLMWLLLATAYLFPGLGKLVLGGMDWLNGTCLKVSLSAYPAAVPWLSKQLYDHRVARVIASLATVLFEVSFTFMIFAPATRRIIALGGMFFHTLSYLCLNISFWPIQVAYCTFIEWSVLLERLGKRIFPDMLHVRYESTCDECRKLAGVLAVTDIFRRVEFHCRSGPEIKRAQASTEGNSVIDLHAIAWHGINCTPQMMPILVRFPIYWPFMLVPAFLHKFRGGTGSNRFQLSPSPSRFWPLDDRAARAIRVTALTGTLFLTGNIVTGSIGLESCWPVGCMPIFVTPPVKQRVSIDFVSDGKLNHTVFGPSVPYLPLQSNMVSQLCQNQSRSLRQEKLEAIWKLIASLDKRCRSATRASFFEETYCRDVVAHTEKTLERRLLGEIDFAGRVNSVN